MPEYIYMVYLGTSKFKMNPTSNPVLYPVYTHTQIHQGSITEINSVLRENLSSKNYRSTMDQMMIYAISPVIGNYEDDMYVTVLMIRTLDEIDHPLFRTCEQAFNEMKLHKIFTFDEIYDACPGMRFNNLFKGTFFDMDEQNNVKFNPQS